MGLKWETKSKIRGYEEGEVFIRKVNDDRSSTAITFKQNSHLRITRTQHIVFAIDGTKLYFREASEFEGFKLCSGCSKNKPKKATSFTIKVHPTMLPLSKIEAGAYNLELDKYLGLYYIDVQNKLKQGVLRWNGKRN